MDIGRCKRQTRVEWSCSTVDSSSCSVLWSACSPFDGTGRFLRLYRWFCDPLVHNTSVFSRSYHALSSLPFCSSSRWPWSFSGPFAITVRQPLSSVAPQNWYWEVSWAAALFTFVTRIPDSRSSLRFCLIWFFIHSPRRHLSCLWRISGIGNKSVLAPLLPAFFCWFSLLFLSKPSIFNRTPPPFSWFSCNLDRLLLFFSFLADFSSPHQLINLRDEMTRHRHE